jgi:MFS family permease
MLSLMYFCYGYSIDIYLDWFPKYLYDARGRMGFYASLPFIAGAAGDVLGGIISDRWAARTKNLAPRSGQPRLPHSDVLYAGRHL